MRLAPSLFLLALPSTALADVIVAKQRDPAKPLNDSTLAVVLECSAVDTKPQLKYAGLDVYEREAARFVRIASRDFDQVIHLKNPSSKELKEAIPGLVPEDGTYRLGVLVVAAAGFGSEHKLDGLVCRDFNALDQSTPDGLFPFEGTLARFNPLRDAMFRATDATVAILDTSPDIGMHLDLPQGITAVGPNADQWKDEHGFAVSAAGPGKNAKVGLVQAFNDVLEGYAGSLTVRVLRQKLRGAAAALDGTIVAYDDATGRMREDDTVLFSVTPTVATIAPPAKPKKKPPVVPIASYAVAAGCLAGGGYLGYQANAMYERAIDDPRSYEGMDYKDVVTQYDTYKWGGIGLAACAAGGIGLGTTVLLTNQGNLGLSLMPTGLNLSGAW